MAIGSIAVVANAEDTAAATKLVKNKADLEAFVKTFDKFRDDGVFDYGTTAGDQFVGTLEFAENVVNDSQATVDDYTAAYKMLDAVYNSLRKYSAEELKALIDSCKSKYDTENIMNDDLGDLWYTESTFTTFSAAYEEAERVVDSGDSRLITDAYYTLKSAADSLVALTPITKANFRTALKNYEALFTKSAAYDSWRRGTVGGWISDDDYSKNYWAIQKSVTDGVSDFGSVKDVVFGNGKVNFGWTDDNGNSTDPVIFNIGTAASVKDYINDAYDEFDQKNITKTTNEEFITAYTVAVRAVEIFNQFKADNTERATKASVTKILDQYHKQLVAKYMATTAEDFYVTVNGKTTPENWQDASNAYYGAELKNEGSKGTFTTPAGEEVTIAKGISLLKYIDVTSADVTDANTKAAMEIAEKYLAGSYSDTVYGLDESGKVNTGSGSVAEFTIVYRALKYALEDEFNGTAVVTHTKKDVQDLVNAAYDLADATGDAAIFNVNHMALVEQRQAAQNWIREANKAKAKDGDAVNGQTSSDVWTSLNNAYKALSDQLANYKYSYGEVFNKIAEVSSSIDANDLEATESLTSALTRVAIALATVEASDADNEAFTSDRVFIDYNRVYTADSHNGSESELQAAYENLLAEVKKQTEKTVLVGDVNGDGLVNALDAAEILKAQVGLRDAIDVAVGDVNGDLAVNASDATEILKRQVQ